MRFVPVWTMLPLILLAACQSAPQSGGSAPPGRPCTQRMADSGQCNYGSIYVFPELANVR